MTTYKITNDRTAAVSTLPDVEFLPMDNPRCPVGVKVLLLNPGDAAILGQWDGRDSQFKGWFPVPRKPRPSTPPDPS